MHFRKKIHQQALLQSTPRRLYSQQEKATNIQIKIKFNAGAKRTKDLDFRELIKACKGNLEKNLADKIQHTY